MGFEETLKTIIGDDAEKLQAVLTAHTGEINGLKKNQEKWKDEAFKFKSEAQKKEEIEGKLKELRELAGVENDEDLFNKMTEKEGETKKELLKLKRDWEKAQKETEQLKKTATDSEKYIKELLVKNKIKSYLHESGLSPELSELTLSDMLLKNQFKISKDEHGNFVAELEDGRKIEDYLTDWKNSDFAKKIIPAPASSGSGANGSSNVANKKSLTLQEIEKLPAEQRIAELKNAGYLK